MEPDPQVYCGDEAGDFAAGYREDILKKIRERANALKPADKISEQDFYDAQEILYYVVILTTLARHVPFEDCANEFIVMEPDEIRELKTKFMADWDKRVDKAVEIQDETYRKLMRERTEKAFDDLIEVSENPPQYGVFKEMSGE